MMKKTITLLLALCLTATCFLFNASAALTGDVNGDGKIGPDDARLALRASVGLENLAKGSAAFTAADANRDGCIGSDDARYILRGSVGLENLETLSRSIDWILTNNAKAWQGYANKSLLAAYYAQVKKLTDLSGKGRIVKQGRGNNTMDSLSGLSVVRLVDLDKDGTPELYCGYSSSKTGYFSDREALYRWNGKGVETLFEDSMTNHGSDYSPLVWFREQNGTTYFIAGMCFYRTVYELKNGELSGTTFYFPFENYAYINGEKVSIDRYDKELDACMNGGVDAKIWIYDYTKEAAANYQATLKETEAVIALLAGN